MRYAILPFCLVALIAVPNPSYGCDIISVRVAPPKAGSVRIVAVIAGYGVAIRPAPHLESAPTLHVHVQEVVDGTILEGDAEIVLLPYGPDCRSTPYQPTDLERVFPIGSQVVAFGVDARARSAGRAAVLAEANHGGYVARVPRGVLRTRYGDLDFQRFDPTFSRSGQFGEFEFDRVIVTLSKSSVKERVSRLRNLAYYSGLSRVRDPQQFYAQLISTSGISERQGRGLREDFDQLLRRQSGR